MTSFPLTTGAHYLESLNMFIVKSGERMKNSEILRHHIPPAVIQTETLSWCQQPSSFNILSVGSVWWPRTAIGIFLYFLLFCFKVIALFISFNLFRSIYFIFLLFLFLIVFFIILTYLFSLDLFYFHWIYFYFYSFSFYFRNYF